MGFKIVNAIYIYIYRAIEIMIRYNCWQWPATATRGKAMVDESPDDELLDLLCCHRSVSRLYKPCE